jgi:hypothetical protein
MSVLLTRAEVSRRWRQRHPGASAADSRARRRRDVEAAANGDLGAIARLEDQRARARKWQKANPDLMKKAVRNWQAKSKPAIALKARAKHLRSTYGITLQDFETMSVMQGGVCAICGSPPSARLSLAVDHDHATGRVRQLLCSPCNLAVGLLGESPERAVLLAEYLKRHGR